MDFFNKAKDSISIASKGFTQKANDVSGIAKISICLKEEEKKINDDMKTLGEQFYSKYHDDAVKLFPELVYSIDTTFKKIEADKKELSILKGFRICANCGSEQDKSVVKCTECGMDLSEAERLLQPQGKGSFCGNCGNVISEGAKFCINCGTKIE